MIAGQLTISATAQAFGTDKVDGPLLVRAKSDNSNPVYVGDANVNSVSGFILEAGDALIINSVSNLEHLYAVGTASDKISFIVLDI